jgi:hypothetical protein
MDPSHHRVALAMCPAPLLLALLPPRGKGCLDEDKGKQHKGPAEGVSTEA